MSCQESTFEIEVLESQTGIYTATLKDENNDPIASADVSSITMTVIEEESGNVVNSRNSQNVFNTNNCTLGDTDGLFTWNIQTGDTDIVNDGTATDEYEYHLVTIIVTWEGGRMPHEVRLKIKNLRSVT